MTTITASAPPPPNLLPMKSPASASAASFGLAHRFAAADALARDIGNFEEVDLQSPACEHRPLSSPRRPPHSPSVRDLTGAAAPTRSPASTTPHRALDAAQLTIPRARSQSRRSPSRPPRAPSPSLPSHIARSLSPRAPSVFDSRALRRRKSVAELEDECRDSDDELPDDAALWNVPLSPAAGGTSGVAGGERRRGKSIPPRPIPISDSLPSPFLSSPPASSSAPPPPPPQTQGRNGRRQRSPSTSPPSTTLTRTQRPRGPRAKSAGPPPARPTLTSRASWNVALADLSREARILTETLSYHAAEEEEAAREGKGRGSGEGGKKGAGKEGVALPPVQRSSVMIDPLPISKEKERVLSRTRPSWLPPKDPKEEQRHLKEYKRMMLAAKEAEKRKAAEAATQQCKKDTTRASLQRVWDEHVLPNWDRAIAEPQTRDLWWRGVAPRARGAVWLRAIGNELALTPESYRRALDRAKEARTRIRRAREGGAGAGEGGELTEKQARMDGWFTAIREDAGSAFPELHLFADNGPLRDSLIDVLDAYAMYRSDVGYFYGLHTIAALLLLNLPDTPTAFTTLANALNRPLPLAFLTHDAGATARAYALASSALRLAHPLLSTHLTENLCLTDAQTWQPMLASLLTNGLDVDRAARVWDAWVFEGDRVILRAAVAVAACLEPQLLAIPPGANEQGRRVAAALLGWGPKFAFPPSAALARARSPLGRRTPAQQQGGGAQSPRASSGSAPASPGFSPRTSSSASTVSTGTLGAGAGYWNLGAVGDEDAFMAAVAEAGKVV